MSNPTTMNRRRWKRTLQVMGAAVGLSSVTAHAVGGSFSPGLLVSWTFGKRGGLGLGTEVSLMHYPGGGRDFPYDVPLNYGALMQAEMLWGEGRSFRGALGLQATPMDMPVAGGELGLALQKDSLGWGTHVHGAAFGSAGVLGLALRGTFSAPGPEGIIQPALVLTLKAPIVYGCPPGRCDVIGRPLRSSDGYLLPEVTAGDSGMAQLAGRLERFDAARQEALAEEWLFAARGEFASIPAFLQLAADLENLGAPEALVDAALAAAEDEVRHARVSFALASAFAERALGPTSQVLFDVPVRRQEQRDLELVRLAVESQVDGCEGEGAAAERARVAAETARDPMIAAVQRMIAREEATHAALGARIVDWCLHEGGTRVERAVRDARAA